MINLFTVRSFCKEDISHIENYDKAIADNTQTWDCHHRLEIQGDNILSVQELKSQGLYYKRPACELILLTHSEHAILHNQNRKADWKNKISAATKGKTVSKETCELISIKTKIAMARPEVKQKLSLAAKGRVLTAEQKNKISAALKGKHLGIPPKNKGLKCFTNGIINVYAKECPSGFIKGTIRNLSNISA